MHDPSETAGLLSDVDQGVANALMEAFADKAHALQADMGAVMWAISMMKAAVVARASSEEEATWVAARFGDMLDVALETKMAHLALGGGRG
jgi:hypothetical protein